MDLNTILIILGVIALVVLVGHGLWSNRREKSQYFDNKKDFSHANETPVAKPSAYQPQAQPQVEIPAAPQQYAPETYAETRHEEVQDIDAAVNNITISLPNSPKPIYTQEQSEPEVDYTYFHENYAPVQVEMPAQPQYEPSSPKISLAEPTPLPQQQEIFPLEENVEPEVAAQESAAESEQPKDVIMLYILASDNTEFHGASLAKSLDDLGFLFSKQQIYQRHLDLNVSSSPVLFSVANIQQPGTFDLYNMADFYTIGVVMFMQLPSHGNDKANLRMMLHAAKTLAEDLGGTILTDKQEIFTPQAEEEYLSRIS